MSNPYPEHVVTAVRDNIAKHYGDLYYCTRDESAWSYGTMSLEDFHTIAYDDDVLDGLTEAALEALWEADQPHTLSANEASTIWSDVVNARHGSTEATHSLRLLLAKHAPDWGNK